MNLFGLGRVAGQSQLPHKPCGVVFDRTLTGMRVAERRRLRSSVAPPTAILWQKHEVSHTGY